MERGWHAWGRSVLWEHIGWGGGGWGGCLWGWPAQEKAVNWGLWTWFRGLFKSHQSGSLKTFRKGCGILMQLKKYPPAWGTEMDRWETKVDEMSWGLLKYFRSRSRDNSSDNWYVINSLGIIQSASNISTHLIFRVELWSRYYCYLRFAGEEGSC